MDNVHGKEIPLMHTTVKIPGMKPRGSRTQGTSTSASSHQVNELASELNNLSVAGGNTMSNSQDIFLHFKRTTDKTNIFYMSHRVNLNKV